MNGLIFFLPLLPLVTNADFGGYVDTTFDCPAKTTCPVICVADASECPVETACSDGYSLCFDGTCQIDCSVADETFDADKSPCPLCASVICPSVIDYFDRCSSKYESIYNYAKTCSESAIENRMLHSKHEPGFIVVYVIVFSVVMSMLTWCALNQRVFKVAGSTQTLLADYAENSTPNDLGWTQTGYIGGFTFLGVCRNPIGMTLYFCMMIALLGLQVMLAMMTYFYYVVSGGGIVNHGIFLDETQTLRIFQITWGIACFLTFTLKWPHSIVSLFYRRSLLERATCVAVFAPMEKERLAGGYKQITRLKRVLDSLNSCFQAIMTFVFSDVNHDRDGEVTYCPVEYEVNGNRFFIFRLRRYNFDSNAGKFIPGAVCAGNILGDFLAKNGLSTAEAVGCGLIVGQNTIDIKEPSFIRSVVNEFCKPFYTYQMFMVWTWVPFYFYYMACMQATIITTGGLTVAYFSYRNEQNLYRLSRITGNVQVVRDETVQLRSQSELVPGDLVNVQLGPVYADMIVIKTSEYILVDESALTGESTPTAITGIDPAESHCAYNIQRHKRHVICAGSVVTEVRSDAFAVVLKTGSHTSKGELIRDVLSFKRHSFEFDIQVKLVLLILLCYAIFAFVMCIYFLHDSFVYEWFYGMYIVATALPPLLPTVFVVSVGVSDQRLAAKKIACSNSEGILVAGKVNRVFFDKTGTLTRQGLDFLSASSAITDIKEGEITAASGNLEIGMATCHSLTNTFTGVIVGNQVDIKMFQAVCGTLIQTDEEKLISVQLRSGKTYKILKRFDFDHQRMTMGVVVMESNGNVYAFVKGSGESIRNLCVQSSVPIGFDKALNNCAKEGIYQISMAMKVLPSDDVARIATLSRDEIETALNFVGVINFKNILREETPDVIQQLFEGDVKSTMITGDNVLTGICIARECGMIKPYESVVLGQSVDASGKITWVDKNDEVVEAPTLEMMERKQIVLAVSGSVWANMSRNSIDKTIDLVDYVRVFGRCTPNDKANIMSTFVGRGFICCMVGDGGNDCGALKIAHVGVALSDAEASTVAPFTSLNKCITSVIEVLKEGRCALASAFAAYKYMIIYGQVESISQLIAAYFSTGFSEWCFVFMDGVWVVTMAFTLPLARAAKKLSPKCPTSSLLGLNTMASVLGVLAINFSFTCIALAALWNSPFFSCRKWTSNDVSNGDVIGDNYETSVLFLVTGYQYMSSAMAFNFGYSYRAAWVRNWRFVFLVLCFTIVHLIITLHPSRLSCVWRINCSNEHVVRGVSSSEVKAINNSFNTTVMPVYFRWILVCIIFGNTAASLSWEYYIVNGIIGRWFAAWFIKEKVTASLVESKSVLM